MHSDNSEREEHRLGAGLTEEFFNSLTASSNWGAQLANRILREMPDATAIK